ncbi:hypothetical protein H0E86_25855 [Streptomyces sp. SCSIO-PteL053]|nr:hypothetical protein H0E86_25855 [Streptomyces sp. SCSIO-PteL053]
MPHLFLNEKSCETTVDPDRVNRAMSTMVEAVLAVAREDPKGTALVTHASSLMALQLAQGHPISKWMGAPGTEDLRILLKRLEDKSPYATVFPDGETFSDIAYSHDGVPVEGLGWAHLMGGIGVSLPLDARWNADLLPLVREQLVEDEDGVDSVRIDAEVRHVSASGHVTTHVPWIKQNVDIGRRHALDGLCSGSELWERCADLFPHLLFLPRVEAQLRELRPDWVHPVRKRFSEMDRAVTLWNALTQADGPQWGSKVTPEHPGRKNEHCVFTDLDGETQYFDTHLRFTPNDGRLYFRFVTETRRVHIAHVGRHLGTH